MAIGCLALLTLAPIADAQRNSSGGFQGNWKASLTMDTIFDVPPEHLDRLSKPVDLELRITARNQVEIYFTSPEDEWKFETARGFILTKIPAGDQNAVIDARMNGNIGWYSAVTFNLALKGENALLLSWARQTVRDTLLNDGLDEYGFSGVATLNRIDN